jgi:HSP20 family molecular chaperone IbpA
VTKLDYATAIFRQVNKNEPFKHHDALEFPDGRIVLLTRLSEGQEATVLQLPAQPTTAAEADEAAFKKGVLTIKLPKKAECSDPVKKIQVNSA